MVAISLDVSERDVVKIVLEFLEARGFHMSQLSLERETGIINGQYSDDVLFLRQLILDGSWDAALDFIQPLNDFPEFNSRQFRYLITKYKYFELLCVLQEPGPLRNNEFTVAETVENLKLLEQLCPSKEDYKSLCLLLTLPKLSDHHQFRQWNPSSARVDCFHAIYPLVKMFLPSEPNLTGSTNSLSRKSNSDESVNDRLMQLLVKGLFYESCVDYCQNRAVKPSDARAIRFSRLLNGHSKLADPDLSLVSWLECVPHDVFGVPFEQKGLQLRIDQFRKPAYEASWTEQILATPVKPKLFPHAAVPSAKLRSAEKMSQSLLAGIEFGRDDTPAFINQSVLLHARAGPLSRSTFAGGFEITNRQTASVSVMNKSIDHLFETAPDARLSVGVPGGVVGNMHLDTLQPLQDVPEDSVLLSSPAMHANQSQMSGSVYAQLDEIKRQSLQGADLNAVQFRPRREPSGGNIESSGKLYQAFHKQRLSQKLHNSEHPVALDGATYQMLQSTSGLQNSMVGGRPMSSPVIASGHTNRRISPDSPDVATLTSRSLTEVSPCPSPVKQQHQQNGVPKSLHFVPVNRMEDPQAIRATAFHPQGRYYAVGTNSKQIHICRYPDVARNVSPGYVTRNAEILLTRPKQHRGSVYCVGWNPTGELLATGSNDKTVRLMQFHSEACKIGSEFELTMHDGTVRDLVFIEDTSNRSSLMISGGAGNCKIFVTDCATGTALRQLAGHTAPILGLYTYGGCVFVSCSQDKTVRFWDLRSANAVNVIAPGQKSSSSPVTSVCVDPSGRLLVSGHEDSSVMLYDLSGSKVVQIFRPHVDEVRTVRFSPGTYYLLSGSYDKRIVITDMRGDLTGPLTYIPVAEHTDKIIQCRWHPTDFTFLSTSADRSAVLWALPPAPNM